MLHVLHIFDECMHITYKAQYSLWLGDGLVGSLYLPPTTEM
jgi:hypothetical protein